MLATRMEYVIVPRTAKHGGASVTLNIQSLQDSCFKFFYLFQKKVHLRDAVD